MDTYVAVGGLIVAALALIGSQVSTWVNWRTVKHQVDSAERVALKQVIAPMRQAWIESLRNRVTELLCEARGFFSEDREQAATEKRLTFLKWQIELMLNPKEEDHRQLSESLDSVIQFAQSEGMNAIFNMHVEKTKDICKAILKREWEVVKRSNP